VGHGVDINKETDNGATPLYIACEKGHITVVKYLVERGADISRVNNKGETPLFVADKNGHKDIKNYLIEIGANNNENVKDKEENSRKIWKYR